MHAISVPSRLVNAGSQVIGVFTACILMVSGALAADFIPLGELPGGDDGSVARGVSADGNVVVGYSSGEAFRWTRAGGHG